jgi:hypothetical protein
MSQGWKRFLIFIVGIAVGSNVGFNINMLLGGLIQLATIIYVTKEFWEVLFGRKRN